MHCHTVRQCIALYRMVLPAVPLGTAPCCSVTVLCCLIGAANWGAGLHRAAKAAVQQVHMLHQVNKEQ